MLNINFRKNNTKMIPEFLKNRIELKYGKPIRYPKDCEELSISIKRKCNANVSATTLKRLFGIIIGQHKPRLYTLDILAVYAGFECFKSAINKENIESNSYLENTQQIIIKNLQEKQVVKIKYNPDKVLLLQYCNNFEFLVLEAVNSKLSKNDLLTILRLEHSFPLVCENVHRNGSNLGKYVTEKNNEIIHLSVES